ncbi:MAG: type II toxin-antitoxin system HicA family toxin [Deltaproteobacteria bacterium]|nr:type II toxin-antitoxin system HicA family toxin [Deltaproteobacteria bacterium]
MARLPSFKVRDVIRRLERAGYVRWRQSGGHLSLYRHIDRRTVTVPVHFGHDIPKGTLRAIIREAALTVEEFLAL